MKQEIFMREALKEACKAYAKSETPIGAIIVKDDKIIARTHNLKETSNDPTAHAEILAIREAAKYLKNWRLNDCVMYVSMEPCIMCAGAIVASRLKTVVIGANDTKYSDYDMQKFDTKHQLRKMYLDNDINIIYGVCEEVSSKLVKRFFKNLRRNK